MDLNLVRAFAAVHRTGSFSRAGEQLRVPRSTISRAVAELEDALGTTLFQRTTRRVATTPAGSQLFDRIAPALASLETALADLPRGDEAPSGTLRVTATADFATIVLAEAVTRFTARYPATAVDVRLTQDLVDLVRDGVDLAVRFTQHRLRGASLVARKIGTVTFQLYAAPSYLARRGIPRVPEDLAAHDWVAFCGIAALKLTARTLERVVVARTRVSCDDMFFTREVLRQGGGIGALPSFVADPEVAAGGLVRVLPRWLTQTGSVYLVRPDRKHVPPAVTAFSSIVLEMLRQRPLPGPDAA